MPEFLQGCDPGDDNDHLRGYSVGPWKVIPLQVLFPPAVYRKYFKGRKNRSQRVTVPEGGTIRVESVDGDSITYSVGPFTEIATPPRPSRKLRFPLP